MSPRLAGTLHLIASRPRGTKIYQPQQLPTILIKQESRQTSYLQERDALLRLNESRHHSIPRLYRFNDQEQWLAIEKMPGQHLHIFYDTHPATQRRRFSIIMSLLDIFDHIHSLGIAHFDTHYENILYDPCTEKISLIDFGSCGIGKNIESVMLGKLRSPYCESKKRFYRAPELTKHRVVNGALAERYGIVSLIYALVWGLAPLNRCYPLHSDKVDRVALASHTRQLPHFVPQQESLLQAILDNFEPHQPHVRRHDTTTLRRITRKAFS